MDEKKQIDNLVDQLDAVMNGGKGHIGSCDLTNNSEKNNSSCTFTSDVNDCPTCANIPNISDIDED